MQRAKFEALFRQFVEHFGGEIVPEEAGRSADYFFHRHNVVAELKCLIVDQTTDTFNKLRELTAKHQIDTNSRSMLLSDGFLQEWQKVLLAPIENIIRDANRQIRATKERLAIPSAHGVILIFNEGNPLHALDPRHNARLVGEVIQKPKLGHRRFPNIQGMVYFSFGTIKTFDEQIQQHMPFWLSAQVRSDSVEEVKRFQDDLKLGWYQHIERMIGALVRSHYRETGWSDV
ncbi:MAG TPA: hypothetical protein VH369_07815 [Bryobacteraceae bacterium]|jgi:hypothetical protein